ncbi:MAG: TIGR04084 family radical SAM/SPASM domain-containing protein [Methanomicrobiales archaeon]
MFYHIILTDECNLCCSYCRGKSFEVYEDSAEKGITIDPDLPTELSVSLPALYHFLSQDPEAVLTFYGGEPLMRSDLVHEILHNAPVARYMLQTNGTLLDRIEPADLNMFETILVSIDGSEWLTDGNRGTGTYRKVVNNLHCIREMGYRGELIARMTVNERTNIYDSVRFLSDNDDFPFSSIHWQIDANFANDFNSRNFEDWVEHSYNPGITMLVRYWLDCMKKEGKVPRWYPFLDPTEDLLNNRPSRLRCGAGYANYSIMTDGSIAACPVMVGMKDYYLGHITCSAPAQLPELTVRGRCTECEILDFCGGRCLYSTITKPWTEDQNRVLCRTISHLHECLAGALPEVSHLMKDGTISPASLLHTKFNGCEIIP